MNRQRLHLVDEQGEPLCNLVGDCYLIAVTIGATTCGNCLRVWRASNEQKHCLDCGDPIPAQRLDGKKSRLCRPCEKRRLRKVQFAATRKANEETLRQVGWLTQLRAWFGR